MKVSVIIAAYNAEKYLTEALESVVHQTIDDYEIIIVNDGSTDSTGTILQDYGKKYSNIHIIDKENAGPSSARNAGLDIAKGEYVSFIDADDVMEVDALECLYERAVEENADLVIAKYDTFNKDKVNRVTNIDGLVVQQKIDKYDLLILWTFSLWNKLYKRSLIEQYNFRFAPISYSEDGVFSMNFVYHAKKITGLDKVVYHYRRMYDGETDSITASVSSYTVRDYITAHHMILDSARESLGKDFPQSAAEEITAGGDSKPSQYLNEIIRKELQVLLNQFYMKFWAVEESVVRLIVDEIQEKLRMLDMYSVSMLDDAYPEVSLWHLAVSQEEMLKNALFTAVLYGNEERKDKFLICLKSLLLQNLIPLKIVVPETMSTFIEEQGMMRGNIVFEKASSEKELFFRALQNAETPYITFCDAEIVYAATAFSAICRRFFKVPADFMAEVIYHRDYEVPQPIVMNKRLFDSMKKGKKYSRLFDVDDTLANKFFRVGFLKRQSIDFEKGILSALPAFYRTGYYQYYDRGTVIYENSANSFAEYIGHPELRDELEKEERDKKLTLSSPEIISDPGTSFQKLMLYPGNQKQDKILRRLVLYMQKLKLKNQVLFFSIRKDGELEGNAKALYPYVEGRKVISAKRLPHDWFTMLKMFYQVMTSKVIVTDDYVRYLRYFPLRPEQRVIQLWHACGAFKKFGQRGTNIAIATDVATHAQYNLVCVSGAYIRSIYADAFSIEPERVRALGCPRTDEFFNQPLIQKKKEQIYKKYPELKEKFVIIYAPTFRDVGRDRTVFQPELDFDRLSEALLPEQELLICPHPIMKKAILPKQYRNIREIRDFSTNDLMFVSDMLITDYSSVIFEYALLRKPIAFFCYDLTTYNRGFYLNYPEDLPGDVYETQEALTEYLRHPDEQTISEKYDKFLEKYMSGCDGHSCERIAELINEYMKES